MLNKLFRRLRSHWRKNKIEREMDKEMRFHLEMETEKNISKGMGEKEARLAAQRSFGGIERAKEAYRDLSRIRWLEEVWQDLRYGGRILLKNPAFTLIVALSLALGIGANTVVFSLLDAVLLKTLPVEQPERLVLFRWLAGDRTINFGGETDVDSGRDQATGLRTGTNFSTPAFEHFRAHNQSLSEIFAFVVLRQVNLNVDGQAEVVEGQVVSGNYFAGLGAPALLGRTLIIADDRADAEPVVVISYRYWQRRFSGDPAAVGKVVYLSNTAFTIVGVTPPEFYGALDISRYPDVSVPLALLPQVQPYIRNLPGNGYWWLNIMGRLKLGESSQQAQAELNLLLKQHVAGIQEAATNQLDAPQLVLASGSQGLIAARRNFSQPLKLLMIIVGLVLAVACLNVANLLLARAATRRKEIAVRQTAGASRLRLIRQLLTESLLLSSLGGVLGFVFAYWGKDALLALHPLGITTLPDINLDLRVLGYTAIITVLTGILFGLAPALRTTKVDLISTLKDGAGHTGYSRSRLSKGLVVAQVAMSLLLLIGAGLFIRTLRNLTKIDFGFNRENLLLFNVHPGTIGYRGVRLANLYPQLLERIEALPGVRSATASDNSMLRGSSSSTFCVPGYTPKPGENMMLPRVSVATNFFETMELPILQGRGLTEEDNLPLINAMAILERYGENPPGDFVIPRRVAVINQAMARKYFPDVNPVGRRFSFSSECADGGRVEIVGITRDATRLNEESKRVVRGLQEEISPTAYLPYVMPSFQAPILMTFAVRTTGDPAMMTTAIRKAVQAVEPRLPIYAVKTQEQQITEIISQSRMFAALSSFFGLLALVLVAIGLYGVMSYTVARRTHEIGVRMALGAERSDVFRLVMRENIWLSLAGMIIGVSASFAATRLISNQLFGLEPHDPLTITLVTLLLIAVMTLAGYLPARRAARVDPLIALRYE